MSLLEDIASEIITPGSRCTVAAVLEALEPTDAADLIAAIADKTGTPASAISAALKRRDVDLASNTIQRHRRGNCKCR